jgi:GTP cyclohydrolase II
MVRAGRDAARAIDALRRGWPIAIAGPGEDPLVLLAVETADAGVLEDFAQGGACPLLISSGRAATLKLTNQLAAADPDLPVVIEPVPWLDFDTATALADPQFDLAMPMKGPFRTEPIASPVAALAAIRLARIAGLLPAFFIGGTDPEVTIAPEAIDAHVSGALVIATRARLPVERAEDAEIVAFRAPDSSDEHVALVIGQPDGAPPLVRVHSECLTGDVLGSLKCDCGPQLSGAIAAIRASGWGMVLYLRQEGRGIGLVNKLRAYRLQDQGYDTVDANVRLGFAIDARDFRVAARMLELLGQARVRLLTNNPDKVAGLEAAGIAVTDRVPHVLPANPHNQRYLATKRDRTGHQL